MKDNNRLRIYMTGVGGQGTLTATTLLAKIALDQGLEVVAGEVHGMAQRGGVVESVVMLGGWQSSKLEYGEADLLLGFEPLEALRALAYASKQGKIFCSTDALPPLGVSLAKETYPALEDIKKQIQAKCQDACFIPCRSLGIEAGSVQSGNTAMLGAVCASGALPFNVEVLEAGLRKFMPAKILDSNLKALELGIKFINK